MDFKIGDILIFSASKRTLYTDYYVVKEIGIGTVTLAQGPHSRTHFLIHSFVSDFFIPYPATELECLIYDIPQIAANPKPK